MCRLAVGSLEPAGTFLWGGSGLLQSFASSSWMQLHYLFDSSPAVPQNDGNSIDFTSWSQIAGNY